MCCYKEEGIISNQTLIYDILLKEDEQRNKLFEKLGILGENFTVELENFGVMKLSEVT